ncbi:MAG: 16S rRNA (adenine(1518)-N(6)/adenine(1519)-N(6))-dimethyltransferase RsmA [Actinobacteria bacterium]|jgi:16S rRNA (adenine1518-N6/adenine1519-N6)-dimethyltransferase|nr:16S rRNA (adenine(1518)-N(6)/adenine(1519)-N(6))-dimethyltransferase RsmA [Actinomycetota bacterium]MDA8185467.1 16S rRNA (adenine(1518)-N(6)/adenine(1519)-N(6))-dimethyltransferase RsmA [Actinomycetota bacterium]
MAAQGIRPKKALGQHFVFDENTLRRIARIAGVGPGGRVVEVGAGLGGLTAVLASTGARVVALEIDARLFPVLREVAAGPSVRIVQADALQVDWTALLGGEPGWAMVANLPYNVAARIVVRALEEAPMIDRFVVMVQREVGERLAARRAEAGYGAVSLKVAYFAEARVVGRVPASVFLPRPRVESVLLELKRRSAPPLDPSEVPYDRLFAVVRAGFSQRRKMLRRSLSGTLDPETFDAAGVDPSRRAEELGIEDWGRLVMCEQRRKDSGAGE